MVSTDKIVPKESHSGISYQGSISIFTPTNANTSAKPYCSMENLSCISAIKKYIALSPKMANKLEVSTIKGSVVIANTAGMLSTAKTMSESSTNTKASNKGVAINTPCLRTQKCSPSRCSVSGILRLSQATQRLLDKSASSSGNNILMPVKSKNAPNT